MLLSRARVNCLTRPGIIRAPRISCTDDVKQMRERLTKAFWKPQSQVEEVEFDRLLVPILGRRYSIMLLSVNQQVVVKFDISSKEIDGYMERKQSTYELLNEWGVADKVFAYCAKQAIMYYDNKLEMPIVCPIEVFYNLDEA